MTHPDIGHMLSGFPNALGIQERDLVAAVRDGFPYAVYERLQQRLGLSLGDLSDVLAIPERTLSRRKREGRLTSEESDRVLRLARIVEIALFVFEGDSSRAIRWLTSPSGILGGESPLERSDTDPGAREVEDMLMAIEFSLPA